MADQSTNWYLKLMETVTSPLKKIMDVATGTQKKLSEVANQTQRITATQNVMGKDFKNNLTQLNARLDTLRGLQEKAFSVKHIENYNKAIRKTEEEIAKINRVINPPAPPLTMWGSLKNDLSGVMNQIPGLSNAMSLLSNPIALVAAAILNVGIASGKLAINFEAGMAKVNATAQLGRVELGLLDDRLTEIGSNSGGNFDRIPQTYEKILSVTGKVNQSLELTELAVKGAKAGFTDLDVVGNALARTMNVIEDKTISAKSVLDTLLMAKNVGAGEFQDFAQYLPGLIAGAQPQGYKASDAIGLFTTLSKSFEGMQAATYTENLFTAFKKTDIIYGLEKAGIDVFKNGFRRPIADVLIDLAKLQKTMSPEQFTNFMDAIKLKDVQAATAIGAITGNVENLKTVVSGLNGALGETERQLAATANTARTWADVGDTFKSISKEIGEVFLPVIDFIGKQLLKTITIIKDVLTGKVFEKNYQGWSPENKELQRQLNGDKESRNRIVSDEKEKISGGKGDKLLNANKGLSIANAQMSANQTGAGGSGAGSGTSSSSNKAITQVTMNLNVHNHITTSKDSDSSIKRKMTDLIVDSARDAMVIVGSNQ
jgi:TP901 family phage tail tape measure protein